MPLGLGLHASWLLCRLIVNFLALVLLALKLSHKGEHFDVLDISICMIGLRVSDN